MRGRETLARRDSPSCNHRDKPSGWHGLKDYLYALTLGDGCFFENPPSLSHYPLQKVTRYVYDYPIYDQHMKVRYVQTSTRITIQEHLPLSRETLLANNVARRIEDNFAENGVSYLLLLTLSRLSRSETYVQM